MTLLGERLRATREAHGLSLAEAATVTRILPRYLQALEAGDFHSLPGDVYARGFIRNYAQLLELPPEEMIALYRRERGEATGRIKVVPAAMPPRNRSCLFPSISFVATFLVILFLVVVVYFGAESLGLFAKRDTTFALPTSTRVPTRPTPFPTVPEVTSVAAGGLPAIATPTTLGAAKTTPSAAAGPTPGAAASPTPANQFVVVVSVLPQAPSGSWLEVHLDNSPAMAYNALLAPGKSVPLTPQHQIYMNIGDTSVVQVSVNGQTCPGFPGAVRGVPRRITLNGPACP